MSELVNVLIAFCVGAATGGFFFGGLWWTVRQVTKARRPAWLFLVSFLVRAGSVGAILFLFFRHHGDRLAVALVGFVVARALLIRWLPSRGPKTAAKPTGDCHAH